MKPGQKEHLAHSALLAHKSYPIVTANENPDVDELPWDRVPLLKTYFATCFKKISSSTFNVAINRINKNMTRRSQKQWISKLKTGNSCNLWPYLNKDKTHDTHPQAKLVYSPTYEEENCWKVEPGWPCGTETCYKEKSPRFRGQGTGVPTALNTNSLHVHVR